MARQNYDSGVWSNKSNILYCEHHPVKSTEYTIQPFDTRGNKPCSGLYLLFCTSLMDILGKLKEIYTYFIIATETIKLKIHAYREKTKTQYN